MFNFYCTPRAFDNGTLYITTDFRPHRVYAVWLKMGHVEDRVGTHGSMWGRLEDGSQATLIFRAVECCTDAELAVSECVVTGRSVCQLVRRFERYAQKHKGIRVRLYAEGNNLAIKSGRYNLPKRAAV